jgi:hypothetical protein
MPWILVDWNLCEFGWDTTGCWNELEASLRVLRQIRDEMRPKVEYLNYTVAGKEIEINSHDF